MPNSLYEIFKQSSLILKCPLGKKKKVNKIQMLTESREGKLTVQVKGWASNGVVARLPPGALCGRQLGWLFFPSPQKVSQDGGPVLEFVNFLFPEPERHFLLLHFVFHPPGPFYPLGCCPVAVRTVLTQLCLPHSPRSRQIFLRTLLAFLLPFRKSLQPFRGKSVDQLTD